MEILFIISLVIVGICILIMLITYLTKPFRIKHSVEKINDEEALALQKVKDLFNDNSILQYLDILERIGIPKDVVYSKDSQLIGNYLPFKNDSYAKSIFNCYSLAISNRYDLKYRALTPMNKETYGVNLHMDENLYHIIYNTTLHQEKVVRRDYAYTGIRYSDGLLRGGSLSLLSNEINSFVPIDIGKLFMTNKRIIFIGKQNNVSKSIKIADILTSLLYKDGILISQANKKAIILKFEEYNDDKVMIQDGINEFNIVLNRLIKNNYNVDLTFNENPEDIVEEDKCEEIQVFDKLLKDIAYYTVNKRNASILDIQKEFMIGFYRVGKIMKQLDYLGIIEYDSASYKYNALVETSEIEPILEKLENK